jgi:hypothetical protein
LDIGSEEIVVAVPPDRDPQNVRVFRTFTPALLALVDWLVACGIDTVVMESTGVFWIPIYDVGAARYHPLSGQRAARQDRAWPQIRLE